MKKLTTYAICIIVLVLTLTLCYYSSYKFALHEFNRKANEQSQSSTSIDMAQATESVQDADTKDQVTVSSDTDYILQTYNMATGEETETNKKIPNEFVGLTREQIIDYLNSYMQDVPISEYNKGLVSYQLQSFSSAKVIVKKTYNSDAIIYKYYLCNCDDEIVVYYSDKKTVYENTEITVSSLSEDDQTQLKYGIYVKDEDELYGILENYTS